MAEKTLKARVRLLVKSFADWQLIKDSFVPLNGEVCIVKVPTGSSVIAQEPAVLFKVGDGVSTFAQLGFSSALAADVYAWAKKESLDWSDMSEAYKAELREFIEEVAPTTDTLYQIVEDGAYKWKLQKSEDGGATWADATGNIDVSALVTELGKKVDKVVTGTNGTARIFNEADGGGAKFEHKDGSEAFVGVNDGGEEGLMAQIYADKNVNGEWVGSRINVYHNGIFYVSKANQEAGFAKNAPEMEIVVKNDIKDIAGALHFIGATELAEGETIAQAIARIMAEKSHTPVAGDIVIIKCPDGSKEYLFDGEEWIELGDEGMYATKAALAQEVADREAADEALEVLIEARKLVIFPVSAYGFDTNLRVNQQVDGSELVDAVINATNVDMKQAVIKMGDYKFNVISIVNDENLGIKGFAVETMSIPMATLEDKPALEKGIFLYNPSLGKTCTFYEKDYTSKEIDAVVAGIMQRFEGLADIASTGNVNDLVQTDGDVLILDCNL